MKVKECMDCRVPVSRWGRRCGRCAQKKRYRSPAHLAANSANLSRIMHELWGDPARAAALRATMSVAATRRWARARGRAPE